MDHQTDVAPAKRRTREEIRQIVSEFATSGMPQSEFCGSRGISRLEAAGAANHRSGLRPDLDWIRLARPAAGGKTLVGVPPKADSGVFPRIWGVSQISSNLDRILDRVAQFPDVVLR